MEKIASNPVTSVAVMVFSALTQKQLRAKKRKKFPGFRIFCFLDCESESERTSLGFDLFFVSVACCCGLWVPNIIITKANSKENLRDFVCLLHYESESQQKKERFSFVIVSVRMVHAWAGTEPESTRATTVK